MQMLPRALLLCLTLCGVRGKVKAQNANHIFNAVHNSMRQFGSSLNHNGMSVFIATVPEETQLYHGTGDIARVNGTEWLAFEPEHALAFARPPPRRPPGRGPPDDAQSPNRGRRKDVGEMISEPAPRNTKRLMSHRPDRNARYLPEQILMGDNDKDPSDQMHGYLHTYRTKHKLRLLYLDGQSAAKSQKGTLDMQDIVLLHSNPPPQEMTPDEYGRADPTEILRGPGPMGEYERAERLCTLAEKEWKGRIDGFLRMELGFEIILCSFEKHLHVDRIATINKPQQRQDDDFSLYQAVASRFDGIGGGRVELDLEHFVTLFDGFDALYFDDKAFPRIRNETDLIEPIQTAIKQMVLDTKHVVSRDWQAVTDLVVSRYANRIAYLASGELESMDVFKTEVENTFRPYIDDSHRQPSAETERCATQFFRSGPIPDVPAAKAIYNITTTLCSSLRDAWQQDSLDRATLIMRRLKSWLAWAVWKRCKGCEYHEVCFLPIWPLGGQEYFDHPKCVSDIDNVGRDYWDDPPWTL